MTMTIMVGNTTTNRITGTLASPTCVLRIEFSDGFTEGRRSFELKLKGFELEGGGLIVNGLETGGGFEFEGGGCIVNGLETGGGFEDNGITGHELTWFSPLAKLIQIQIVNKSTISISANIHTMSGGWFRSASCTDKKFNVTTRMTVIMA